MILRRNLGNNIFPTLPIKGLSGLLHLKTFNNPALREFPAPELFPRVRTMVLSYAYHCCPFVTEDELEASYEGGSLSAGDVNEDELIQESVLFPTDNDFDMSLWNQSLTDIWPQLREFSRGYIAVYLFCFVIFDMIMRLVCPTKRICRIYCY